MASAMDRKWGAVKGFLSSIIREPERHPDELAIFVLTDEELHRVFTRERLRILRALRKDVFESVVELSDHLGRDKAAVDRDLKLLEGYGLVKLVKKGRRVSPVLGKEGIYLPLIEPKPIAKLLEEA